MRRNMSENSVQVLIVIVIWNGLEDTLECLASIQRCEFSSKGILVVDNGSTDGSSEVISRLYPGVQILRLSENRGFTGGNNVGLQEALRQGVRYAYLLNNDTTVDPKSLCHMVRCADANPRSGLLSPIIHYYDKPDEIWFAGARVRICRGEAVHDHAATVDWNAPAFDTEWASGCALLVRMSAVTAVGSFDPRYYLTWEDVDWCLRMRSVGYRVIVVPSARILHKGGRSGRKLTGLHFYYAVRNSLLLAKKHGGVQYVSALIWVLIRYIRCALRSQTDSKRKSLTSVVRGIWHHLIGKYGPAPVLWNT